MDWRDLLMRAIIALIERFGPQVLEAIGELILMLIRSLMPDMPEEDAELVLAQMKSLEKDQQIVFLQTLIAPKVA